MNITLDRELAERCGRRVIIGRLENRSADHAYFWTRLAASYAERVLEAQAKGFTDHQVPMLAWAFRRGHVANN